MTHGRPVARRALFGFTALCLAAGGALHALAYGGAERVMQQSALPDGLHGVLKALWLSQAGVNISWALAFGVLAARPEWAVGRLVGVLVLGPLASAILLYATLGSFFPAHVLLGASLAALAAATIPPRAAPSPAILAGQTPVGGCRRGG